MTDAKVRTDTGRRALMMPSASSGPPHRSATGWERQADRLLQNRATCRGNARESAQILEAAGEVTVTRVVNEAVGEEAGSKPFCEEYTEAPECKHAKRLHLETNGKGSGAIVDRLLLEKRKPSVGKVSCPMCR